MTRTLEQRTLCLGPPVWKDLSEPARHRDLPTSRSMQLLGYSLEAWGPHSKGAPALSVQEHKTELPCLHPTSVPILEYCSHQGANQIISLPKIPDALETS